MQLQNPGTSSDLPKEGTVVDARGAKEEILNIVDLLWRPHLLKDHPSFQTCIFQPNAHH